VTETFIYLHWLRVPDRVHFKVAVLVYSALHSTVLYYMTSCFRPATSHGLRELRSVDHLVVPRTRSCTVGDRSFPVAGTKIWKTLPSDVISSPSLSAAYNFRLFYTYFHYTSL
jgi:hypothetical protein